MENRVELSVEVVWDGLKEYECNKEEYDYMGNMHNMSGIEYTLIQILCQGNRFSHHAEALVKKIFGLKDSPSSTSHHDAQFYHPFYGLCTLENRCMIRNTSVSYSSEIGGGGRSATEKTEANGGKTFQKAHERTMHKILHTDFFSVCDLQFMPRVRITIINSKMLYKLWNNGILVDSKRKKLLPQQISRNQFYKIFYGNTNSNVGIKWEKRNPWNLSQKRIDDNISIFNNECGYEETIKRFNMKIEKKVDIEDAINKNPDIYQKTPYKAKDRKLVESSVDIFSTD